MTPAPADLLAELTRLHVLDPAQAAEAAGWPAADAPTLALAEPNRGALYRPPAMDLRGEGKAEGQTVWQVAYRPDGRSVRRWEPAGTTGPLLPVPYADLLSWRPDGRKLASGLRVGSEVRVHTVPSGREELRLRTTPVVLAGVRALAYHPDGRHLGVVNPDGTVFVLRVEGP
jgi:hypothetical protein